jgi:hypothetical protein
MKWAIPSALGPAVGGSVGFAIAYARNAGTPLQGAALGTALLGFTLSALFWAFRILDREQTEYVRVRTGSVDVRVPLDRSAGLISTSRR